MTYTGSVTPGGPEDSRELTAVSIRKLAVDQQMSNNCYLFRCNVTGDLALIDAANESDRLLNWIGPNSLRAVITTHQHPDHIAALDDIVSSTGAFTYAGTEDADAITERTGVDIDFRLIHGDTISVGEATLEIVALRGHTPGSIALAYRDPEGITHLFTGDSLFPGGVGNTRGDAEKFTQLMDDVEERIFDVYDDDTWFYPGHGDDSTLGAQRPHLAEWRERGW